MSYRDVDTIQVIDAVRVRKQLWDATDPLHKNKEARNKCWEDIVDTIFENAPEEEKKELERMIKQRWKTARDAYFKTRNAISTPSPPKYKKYVYYDELSFLTSSNDDEVDESVYEAVSSPPDIKDNAAFMNNTTPAEDTPSNIIQEQQDNAADFNESSQRTCTGRRKRRSHQTNQENSQIETEPLPSLSNQNPESDLAADDLAFFYSLGPILRNFDLEQKLEFRMKVLRNAMEIIQ